MGEGRGGEERGSGECGGRGGEEYESTGYGRVRIGSSVLEEGRQIDREAVQQGGGGRAVFHATLVEGVAFVGKSVHLDGFGVGVHDPVFADAVAFVEPTLDTPSAGVTNLE